MGNRCVVIGAAGQLGMALCTVLQDQYDVIEGVHGTPQPGQRSFDLAQPSTITAGLDKFKPAWIVIAGAFCNVDRAEEETEACLQVNVGGPRAITMYAKEHQCGVVCYSTDHVFDGSKQYYAESDLINPLNHYAKSKAQCEAALRETLPERHLIIRTAWLYGPDSARRNFVLRLVDQLAAGQDVVVPVDQWGSPTYTEDVAAVTRFLMERGHYGTFHATGPEFIDRVSFARKVCEHFDLNVKGVVATPTSQLGQLARRPLRVRLDCQKLQAVGAAALRDIDAGLSALRSWQLVSQRALI